MNKRTRLRVHYKSSWDHRTACGRLTKWPVRASIAPDSDGNLSPLRWTELRHTDRPSEVTCQVCTVRIPITAELSRAILDLKVGVGVGDMNRQTHYVDSEGIVRAKEPEWVEVFADVNILYGAMWIKDHGDWADIVEVTDLDGACGAADRVLVTEGSIGLYGNGLRANIKRLKDALEYCGSGAADHRRMDDREE